MQNSVPALIDELRPDLHDVAEWVGVSRALAAVWQKGAYQPRADDRARLVKAVRKHAARLLLLALRVEEEGRKREVTPRRRGGGRRGLPAPVRHDAARGSAARRRGARGGNGRFVDWDAGSLHIEQVPVEKPEG